MKNIQNSIEQLEAEQLLLIEGSQISSVNFDNYAAKVSDIDVQIESAQSLSQQDDDDVNILALIASLEQTRQSIIDGTDYSQSLESLNDAERAI